MERRFPSSTNSVYFYVPVGIIVGNNDRCSLQLVYGSSVLKLTELGISKSQHALVTD